MIYGGFTAQRGDTVSEGRGWDCNDKGQRLRGQEPKQAILELGIIANLLTSAWGTFRKHEETVRKITDLPTINFLTLKSFLEQHH